MLQRHLLYVIPFDVLCSLVAQHAEKNSSAVITAAVAMGSPSIGYSRASLCGTPRYPGSSDSASWLSTAASASTFSSYAWLSARGLFLLREAFLDTLAESLTLIWLSHGGLDIPSSLGLWCQKVRGDLGEKVLTIKQSSAIESPLQRTGARNCTITRRACAFRR